MSATRGDSTPASDAAHYLTDALDNLTKIAAGASAGAIVILGMLMFVRMRSEVLDARGQQATAVSRS